MNQEVTSHVECLNCGASIAYYEKLCPVCEIEFEEQNDDDAHAFQNGQIRGFNMGYDAGFIAGHDSAYEDRLVTVIAFFVRNPSPNFWVRLRDFIIREIRHKHDEHAGDDIPF